MQFPAAANQRRPFSNRLLHPGFFSKIPSSITGLQWHKGTFCWGGCGDSPIIGAVPPVNIGLGSSERGLVEGDKATRFAAVLLPALFSASPDFLFPSSSFCLKGFYPIGLC
jgi:hypothetical protein